MGILIQEVVGSRVGKYFLPTFAGVAFSNNEFRWSARIKREDGLVRLVPGPRDARRRPPRRRLPGPRRAGPAGPARQRHRRRGRPLLARGRSTSSTWSPGASRRSSSEGPPRGVRRRRSPAFEQIVSVADESGIHRPSSSTGTSDAGRLVVTFDGLVASTPFLARMRALLRLLQEKTGGPVDIEFASDGKDLYLLQCRPQSFSDDAASAPIPRDLPADKVIFRRDRYVSNGRVPDITHIVYVDPERLRGARGRRRAQARRPRRRPPEQGAAEAAVHPDGAGTLGKPRRHASSASP